MTEELSPRAALRHTLNLVNGSTGLGLLLAVAGGARLRPGPNGLVIAEGYRYGFPLAQAFTVGDVIITAGDLDEISGRLPAALAHEEVHANQYAYCFGLPFLPLYAVTMAWSWLRTGDRSSACFFEQEAGLMRGGYPVRALRAWPWQRHRSRPPRASRFTGRRFRRGGGGR